MKRRDKKQTSKNEKKVSEKEFLDAQKSPHFYYNKENVKSILNFYKQNMKDAAKTSPKSENICAVIMLVLFISGIIVFFVGFGLNNMTVYLSGFGIGVFGWIIAAIYKIIQKRKLRSLAKSKKANVKMEAEVAACSFNDGSYTGSEETGFRYRSVCYKVLVKTDTFESLAISDKQYFEGQNVTIYIDPENTKYCHIVGAATSDKITSDEVC